MIPRPLKRLKICNDPESSAADLHSAPYGEPELLNLGRKVFLSHSGMDKDFVRRLNKEIRRSYHGVEVTFFDEESILKGKAINMEKSIVEEARRSALGVLVVTDDFFMYSPNPMLELEAFVAGKVDLLPLFLKMSVVEFKQKERWNKWEEEWKKWAAADDKLKIDKWRSYLPAVSRYNGLEFCKIAPCGREDLYIDEVVRQVACIIGPVFPMSGKDVYGKVRLCQMIDNMYKECSSKRAAAEITSTPSSLGLGENSSFYAYDVVGIHGFSGLGKTTVSKCLCDFYFQSMKGNVCYIDLGLSSETGCSRMQHVLSKLDRRNCKDIYSPQLDDNQVKNLLEVRLSSMEDPVFFAIDNIPPETKPLEEALIYLRCNFPKGSKILITSRTERTLRELTNLIHHSCSSSVVIEYMPELEYKEARDIFEHEFPDLHNFQRSNISDVEENIQRDVDACVRMCTIFNRRTFHPLMLKSLAASVKWDQLMPNLDWKGRLAKLASEGIVDRDDAWDQVYQLFDNTYKLLIEEEKKVFLDLALCYNAISFSWYEWIHALHVTPNFKEKRLEKILLRLHNFCFIEKEGRNIKIHDLNVGFGKHKTGADISDEYLVLEDGGPDWLDALPRTARHVSISRCGKADQLRTLDLRDVEGVTVLHLLDNAGLGEVLLSRTSSAHLRSMIVRVPAGTALRCVVQNEDWSSQSLKWLDIQGDFNFCFQPASERSLMLPNAGRMDPGSTFLGGFRNLQHFTLDSLLHGSVQTIDLTPCANLKQLYVHRMPGLKSIRGPESSSHLEYVSIWESPHLEELAFTVIPAQRTNFEIESCASLRQVSLNCTTPSTGNSGKLYIRDCPLLPSVDGLSQYLADGSRSLYFRLNDSVVRHMFWPETFVDILKDARIDSSRCKATVRELDISEAVGLGGVTHLNLEDAQHIGLLISALFQAHPPYLRVLKIRCQQAGNGSCGCTCDQNPPIFCALPDVDYEWEYLQPEFQYCCKQVRDLSSLGQWHSLRKLTLSGCTSVEVWPDFAAMTSLQMLDLSDNTSLREWPSGVHLLSHLEHLDLRGCPQLPAKEVMLRTIRTITHHWDSETNSWCSDYGPFQSLGMDLVIGTRDRCTVAVALGELSVELAAIFDRWWPHSRRELNTLCSILYLIHTVWFHGGKQGRLISADGEEQHITEHMRALLSSESFLSLPFRACSYNREVNRWTIYGFTGAVAAVLGIYTALMGGRASSIDSHRSHHLQDWTIFLFRKAIDFLLCVTNTDDVDEENEGMRRDTIDCSREDQEAVREEVGVVVSRMAREAGLEVEEGSTESEELQELREMAVGVLCALVARNPGEVDVDDIIQNIRKLDFPVDCELKLGP